MKVKLLIVALCLLLVGSLLFWFLDGTSLAPSSDSSSSSQIQKPEQAQDLPLTTEPITVKGQMICLPHKNTSGPQTLECAIGMKAESGVNYALRSDDPTATGSLGTATSVEVTGTLQKAEPNSKYDTAGTIQVQSIKRL